MLRNISLSQNHQEKETEIVLVSSSLIALSCLMCKLQSDFLPFILPIRRKTQILLNYETTRHIPGTL
jgi:hypothetical protein